MITTPNHMKQKQKKIKKAYGTLKASFFLLIVCGDLNVVVGHNLTFAFKLFTELHYYWVLSCIIIGYEVLGFMGCIIIGY